MFLLLGEHIEKEHNGGRNIPTAEADAAEQEFHERESARRMTTETEILLRHAGDFERVTAEGERKHRYLCRHRGLTFRTTEAVMVDHARSHWEGRVQKVYSIQEGVSAGDLRPEQHGPPAGGADTRLEAAWVPSSFTMQGGAICCRVCKVKEYQIDESCSGSEIAARVLALHKRAKQCEGRVRKEEEANRGERKKNEDA